MKDELCFYAAWLWWWAKGEARETWRALPGPWWVKCLIIIACFAIPGPWDEALLLLVLKACRAYRARKRQRLTGTSVPAAPPADA